MRLNPSKCELVGRDHHGQPLTAHAASAAGIQVDGHALVPLAHNAPIRYLGAHMCFDGDWTPQQRKATAKVSMFTRLVSKFNMSIGHAVYMFNVFLLNSLELALHYVHGPGTSEWIKGLDRLIIGSIKHSCGSLLRLSHSALALSLHLLLPSWLEQAIKVSELFIRMNSDDERWGRIGRLSMRQQCPATVDLTTPLPGPNSGTQLTRAVYLAVKKLGWTVHSAALPTRADSRRRGLLQLEPVMGVPTLEHCSSTSKVLLEKDSIHLAHDCWSGWEGVPDSLTDETIDVYTDGSHDPAASSSSWSVVVGDLWLIDNFGSVPSDEQELARQSGHLHGSTMVGSAITCTRGIYPAELQAIARAMAMFPLGLSLHIHSDSHSSITSIRSFLEDLNERARLRSAGRTILRLIWHLFKRRMDSGGVITFSHVRAHTDEMDQHSVGNRMADCQANRARLHPGRAQPLNLRELPLEHLEAHLHMKDPQSLVIIDDIRRTGRNQLKSMAFARWQAKLEKGDQSGQFAHVGTMDMGRTVLKSGSHDEQQTFVHVATNSIHYHLQPLSLGADPGPGELKQRECEPCGAILTVHHLMTCPEPLAIGMRRDLQLDILAAFGRLDECQDWCRAMSRLDHQQMARTLFPPPAAAVSAGARLDHLVRCMIGAFTHSECQRAIKSLGIKKHKEGLGAFDRFRCVCLAHIAKFYASP
jgi:hypothetical protein